MHPFAIVLLQLLCIVTSARASWHGCFVTDTTWAANTNQGFVNVTSKVIVHWNQRVNQVVILAGGMSINLRRILRLSRVYIFQRKSVSLRQLLRDLPHHPLLHPMLKLCQRTQLLHMLRYTIQEAYI